MGLIISHISSCGFGNKEFAYFAAPNVWSFKFLLDNKNFGVKMS